MINSIGVTCIHSDSAVKCKCANLQTNLLNIEYLFGIEILHKCPRAADLGITGIVGIWLGFVQPTDLSLERDIGLILAWFRLGTNLLLFCRCRAVLIGGVGYPVEPRGPGYDDGQGRVGIQPKLARE